MFPLFCALPPLLLGGALFFLPIRRRNVKGIYALIVTVLTSLLVAGMLLRGEDRRMELFRLTDQFVCALRLDGAGKVYIGLAALLWPPAVLYAIEYMGHEKREGNFFAWYTLTYGAAILLAAAENLFTLYIFYEFLTLLTIPLVWHEKNQESTRAALLYMLYLFGGAAIGFAAVILVPALGGETGSFSLGGTPTALLAMSSVMRPSDWPWVALLGFVGFGVKAAVFPMCRWLPTASVAPTPVTALLHAVAVVNAGVFAVLRVLYYEVPAALIQGTWVQTALLILSAATVVYGACMAVREQHLKRRLAWSTVSNLSYMLFGLSLLTPAGMTAGLAHMVFHSLMKIILFFCAGAVLVQTGRTELRQMHGLGRKMPFTFLTFTLAGVSLMGVPPLVGFVSKCALVTAAFAQGGLWPLAGAAALLIAAVLTAVYIFTVVYPAFFMQPQIGEKERMPRDPGFCMQASLIVLCLLLAAASACAGPIMQYLTGLAGGMAG